MRGRLINVVAPVCATDLMISPTMTREQVLNLYFLDARAKLIDLAAFLDRVERSSGEDDFRIHSFRAALRHLSEADAEKARAVLTTLSDPTMEPLEAATSKGAMGAWPQFKH